MLSRSGIHAIRATVALAQTPDEYCGVAALAESTGAPRNYLGKLLHQLSRHGLVESRKGLGGGFRLSRKADQICLFDVLSSIEDVSRWTECALSSHACSEENPCMVHTRWARAREAFLSFLRETNIAELAVNHPKIEQCAPGFACEIRPLTPLS
jgi:Rrf2 family transcriptional regulator, iron-sulfur cluster assembly transcription factor